jgi:predicted RecB family nuclease
MTDTRGGGLAPIILGGYAAKQCAVRTHNDYSPLVPAPDWVPPPELQADFDAGIAFEAEVFAELLRLHPDAVVVDPALPKAEAIAQTVAAMGSGAPLILGGWLPDNADSGRKGKPDILVGVDGGYLPADVKNHKTVKDATRKATSVSSLARPVDMVEVAGLAPTSHYYEDGMQLAHYTRMLQELGAHPGDDRLVGAIIGTSELDLSGVPRRVLVWHDLSAVVRPTYSRSKGKVKRSLLERYDHEHSFRLMVAATAARITGSGDDPRPLVDPIGQEECDQCRYAQWCADQLGPEDASVAITKGRLDVREWKTLRGLGFSTTSALAELDPTDPEFFESYYPEVTHQGRETALKRLNAAVRQARMIRDGVDIEPITDEPIVVPEADIEIDFDIEWDTAGRIYQWGLRIRDGQDDATARYEPVVCFDELDDAGEHALAEQVAALIARLRAEAETSGRTVAVYHWSPVEITMTRKFDSVAAALDGVAVDLLPWLTGTFHVLGSAGIKHIAPLFGFAWAVDDPGGRLSMDKVNAARAGCNDSLQWCLRYNESDVSAQAAIRDGLRRRAPEWGPSDAADVLPDDARP